MSRHFSTSYWLLLLILYIPNKFIYSRNVHMKPIQFSQNKKDLKWKSMVVTENISAIYYSPLLKKKKDWRSQSSTDKVATLLATYYSILFNNSYFREPTLKDLTLLFPTAEPILIQKDTNFILLPLPLPTYHQHAQVTNNSMPFRKTNPCTFIKQDSLSKECVRDMDYSVDNRTIKKQRNSSEWNFKNWYQHTNPALKQDRLTSTLDVTARIRVYQFQDLFPNQATSIPTFPNYSITDYTPSTRPITNQLEWYNSYAHRQYTLLEITPPADNKLLLNNGLTLTNLSNKLQNYSKYLIQEQLSLQRAQCFDFPTTPNTAIIQYFKDYKPAFQYSPVQIKSGIKRLKNILRYKGTASSPSNTQPSTAEPCEQLTNNQPTHNQHVHSINIKQADWTFKSQLIEDVNITRRTPLDNVEPLTLSTNHNPNG